MLKEIDRFAAEGESGQRYTVIVYQEQVVFRPLSGSGSALGGSIEYRLSDGRDVSPVGGQDPEELKIVETDERIWKI